jgi:ABC-2 type transport system permease protein
VIYFVLNFFLYAAIYAALGAMVKRPEEVRGATAIPTIMLVVSFLGLYLEFLNPDVLWLKMVSYIPLLTPTLMLGRLASGNVAGWEIPVTIVLMLVSIYFCTQGAVRIYRHGMLNYGQRPGLAGLLKLARKP